MFQLCSTSTVSVFQLCSSCVPLLRSLCSSCVPVVFRFYGPCVPVVFRLCSSCVPLLRSLCSSCVPVVFHFYGPCVPVVFQLCSASTVPVFQLCSAAVFLAPTKNKTTLFTMFSYPASPKIEPKQWYLRCFCNTQKSTRSKNTAICDTLARQHVWNAVFYSVFEPPLKKHWYLQCF